MSDGRRWAERIGNEIQYNTCDCPSIPVRQLRNQRDLICLAIGRSTRKSPWYTEQVTTRQSECNITLCCLGCTGHVDAAQVRAKSGDG
jgi:hypothetical protein